MKYALTLLTSILFVQEPLNAQQIERMKQFPANDIKGIQLLCKEPTFKSNAENIDIQMSCTLNNAHTGDLIVLTDRPFTEGPRSADGSCLHLRIAGDIHRNIFQYHPATVSSLDLEAEFYPDPANIILEHASMVRVDKWGSLDLQINYTVSAAGGLFQQGPWLFRAKVLAAFANDLTSEDLSRNLPVECIRSLQQIIKTTSRTEGVSLEALDLLSLSELKPDLRSRILGHVENGCDEIISREFYHIFSQDILIEINQMTR